MEECAQAFKLWIYNDSKFSDLVTDGSMPTVLTQISLLLEEQSDQGLHCFAILSASFGSFSLW